LRIDTETKDALEREASRRGVRKTALAETFLREAILQAIHPGIVFRDGPAGRRAGLVGGPDVWELVAVWQAENRNAKATAQTLSLPLGLVHAALGYYADQRAEIDGWVEENERMAREGEAAWRRRNALESP
jgi:hypothetical protein